MDLDRARDFIRRHHHALLATRTRDGGIQQSPVLVGVDAEGRLIISSRETAYKTKNLRRDPWAQVCVFTDKFFGDWVVVEGYLDDHVLADWSCSRRSGSSWHRSPPGHSASCPG